MLEIIPETLDNHHGLRIKETKGVLKFGHEQQPETVAYGTEVTNPGLVRGEGGEGWWEETGRSERVDGDAGSQ